MLLKLRVELPDFQLRLPDKQADLPRMPLPEVLLLSRLQDRLQKELRTQRIKPIH
jgi:hypothetical protein